jgi:DNA-binding NtrC family response regulator
MGIKAKILVVDDEDRFRKTISRILSDKGYEVDEAPDGVVALEKLADGGFDVVLLDMKMPQLSGEETFKSIITQGFDVETVCLTGHVSAHDAMEMIRQGAFDYLLKPASVSEILQKVQQAVERKRVRNGEMDINDLLRSPAE